MRKPKDPNALPKKVMDAIAKECSKALLGAQVNILDLLKISEAAEKAYESQPRNSNPDDLLKLAYEAALAKVNEVRTDKPTKDDAVVILSASYRALPAVEVNIRMAGGMDAFNALADDQRIIVYLDSNDLLNVRKGDLTNVK